MSRIKVASVTSLGVRLESHRGAERRRRGGAPRRGLPPAMSAAACGLPERSVMPRQGRRSWPSKSNGLQLCRWRKGQQAVELWLHLNAELATWSTRSLGCRRHRGHQAEPLTAPYSSTSGELGCDPDQLALKCCSSTGIGTALPCTASAALQTGRTRPSDLCLHSNPHSPVSRAACREARRWAMSCLSGKLQKCVCGTRHYMLSFARFPFGPFACVVITESPQSESAK